MLRGTDGCVLERSLHLALLLHRGIKTIVVERQSVITVGVMRCQFGRSNHFDCKHVVRRGTYVRVVAVSVPLVPHILITALLNM